MRAVAGAVVCGSVFFGHKVLLTLYSVSFLFKMNIATRGALQSDDSYRNLSRQNMVVTPKAVMAMMCNQLIVD